MNKPFLPLDRFPGLVCAIVPDFYNEMRAVSCFKSCDTYFFDTSALVMALVALI
jgi:hypothetical protein